MNRQFFIVLALMLLQSGSPPAYAGIFGHGNKQECFEQYAYKAKTDYGTKFLLGACDRIYAPMPEKNSADNLRHSDFEILMNRMEKKHFFHGDNYDLQEVDDDILFSVYERAKERVKQDRLEGRCWLKNASKVIKAENDYAVKMIVGSLYEKCGR